MKLRCLSQLCRSLVRFTECILITIHGKIGIKRNNCQVFSNSNGLEKNISSWQERLKASQMIQYTLTYEILVFDQTGTLTSKSEYHWQNIK